MVVNVAPGGRTPAGPADVPAVDAWLDARIADAGYPGASVAIVRGGQVVDLHTVGAADASGRPVATTTPFVIGSLSKSLTALAVLRLVEAGQVALEAPVTTYLPGFRTADPATASITITELLDQTSGLPSDALPLSAPDGSIADAVGRLATVPLASAPGTTYHYSNANYAVLGAVVETVTGRSFAEAIRGLVFEPLDMAHTTADLAEAERLGLGDAHRLWFGLAMARSPLWRTDLASAGFMASTPADLAHPIEMLLAGGRYAGRPFLSEASVARWITGTVPTGLATGRYAMGWIDDERAGLRTISHAGSTTDMAALQAVAPTTGTAVIVLADAQSVPFELLGKIDGIGLGALDLLVGRAPSGTLDGFYPIVDVVLAVLFVRWGLGLVRAARRVLRPSGPAPVRPGRLRWLGGLAFRGYIDVVAPVVILVRMPDLLGAPWPILVRTDVGLVLFVVAALRLSDGGIRGAGWLRARRGGSGGTPGLDAHTAPVAG